MSQQHQNQNSINHNHRHHRHYHCKDFLFAVVVLLSLTSLTTTWRNHNNLEYVQSLLLYVQDVSPRIQVIQVLQSEQQQKQQQPTSNFRFSSVSIAINNTIVATTNHHDNNNNNNRKNKIATTTTTTTTTIKTIRTTATPADSSSTETEKETTTITSRTIQMDKDTKIDTNTDIASFCWSLWLNGEHPFHEDGGIIWEPTGKIFDKNKFRLQNENSVVVAKKYSRFFRYVEEEQLHNNVCQEELSWRLQQQQQQQQQERSDESFINNNEKYTKCLPSNLQQQLASSSNDNMSNTIIDFDPYEFINVWKGRTLVISGDSLSKMFYEDLVESLVLANLDVSTDQIRTSFKHLDLLHWNRLLFQCRAFQQDVILCSMWGPGSDGFREQSFNVDSLAPFHNKMITKHTAILKDILKPHDVILWNVGVHEGTDEESLQRLKESVEDIIQSYRKNNDGNTTNKSGQAQLWWRETLPQHFKEGYYNGIHTADHCFPTPSRYGGNNHYSNHNSSNNSLLSSSYSSLGPYNDVTTPIIKAAGGIPIFPTYRSAVPLYKAHYEPRRGDCTHFCHGKWGPHDLHKTILTQMAKDAIRAGALPPVPAVVDDVGGRTTTTTTTTTTNSSSSSLQQRWDALMEDPVNSALSRMEVCATKKMIWDKEYYGPIPKALHTCLCSTYFFVGERKKPILFPGMVQYLRLESTCNKTSNE